MPRTFDASSETMKRQYLLCLFGLLVVISHVDASKRVACFGDSWAAFAVRACGCFSRISSISHALRFAWSCQCDTLEDVFKVVPFITLPG